MNKVIDKLPKLVAEELEAANASHPPFNSLHEAFAVILEEFYETEEATTEVKTLVWTLWKAVRNDNALMAGVTARELLIQSKQVAAEAVQLAAMAQKLLDYISAQGAGQS